MPYTFEGSPLGVGSEPVIKNGVTWVPVRALGTALGGNVDWDPDSRVAILYLGDIVASFKEDDATADINGEQWEMPGATYLEDGEAWIPARLFERLGYGLQVDTQSKTVNFANPV